MNAFAMLITSCALATLACHAPSSSSNRASTSDPTEAPTHATASSAEATSLFGRSTPRFAQVAQLSVGQAPHQIVFNAGGDTVYIAAAGSDKIVAVQVATLRVVAEYPVEGVPLGIAVRPDGDLVVSCFRGVGIVHLPLNGGDAEPPIRLSAGASLLTPLGLLHAVIPVEEANEVVLLRLAPLRGLARIATGARPFPPAVSEVARRAFVPNYDAGTLSVIDLDTQQVHDTLEIGERPSGGCILPGNAASEELAAIAVRGENRVALISVATAREVGEITTGIGDEPFSVIVAPDGRHAFVNNTASHDVSVIALPAQRVIARIPTGEIPIVIAVAPDGATLWVACEGSHTLEVYALGDS